ncbi:MAG: hypothetical protein QOJ39_617 [Candidatus Eremiobacteraeota bacterium]|jgi:hypothetical protein|nr:hypothetical protein [Candidatus Eremiobacteraeota bacterium]
MARFDPARILRASSIRVGDVRVRGVPAILLGVSAIVLSAGTVRALARAAPSLGEALREATKLVDAVRSDRGDPRRLNA